MGTDFDLYEFPEGHTGRKSYVSVRGHSKSVPKCYTYKGMDGRNYVLPEYGGSWDGVDIGQAGPSIMRDMGEYVSPLDGSHITSRSQHRDHVRKHNVIELGNETVKPVPHRSSFDGRQIRDYVEHVRSMPQRQYDERVQRLERDYSNG